MASTKAEVRPPETSLAVVEPAPMPVEALMQTIAARPLMNGEFNRLRNLLAELPGSDDDPDRGERRLSRAQRYLRSDEVGSALYELKLLVGALQQR